MTTLGSALVYLSPNGLNEKLKSINLGFASGVMIASSIWSLLLPAIEYAKNEKQSPIIFCSLGFICGGLILFGIEKIVEKVNKNKCEKFSHTKKLFLAVTLHNIPEGLAVGLALGLGLVYNSNSMLLSAMGLAIGIGIQNLPEGLAVSLPIKAKSTKNKGFLFGFLSGVVEPIAALLGMLFIFQLLPLMSFSLSLAAGAMMYVVISELIPEAQISGMKNYATWGFIIGFVVMMVLDVALG